MAGNISLSVMPTANGFVLSTHGYSGSSTFFPTIDEAAKAATALVLSLMTAEPEPGFNPFDPTIPDGKDTEIIREDAAVGVRGTGEPDD